MFTLHVKSLPFKEVIKDLANQLNVKATEDCEVYFLKIPKSHGSGSIGGINFPLGIGLIYYNCTFHEDVVIKFDVSDVHPAKFLYCKEGYLRHCFLDSDEAHDLDQYQSAIVASKGISGHQIQFKGGVQTEVGSLEIDRKKFESQIACDLNTVSPSLRKLFQDTQAKYKFYHEGQYSAELNHIMGHISKHSGSGLIRRMYLQAKSLEILTEQIRQYSDDRKDKTHQNLIRQSELVKIAQLSEIIRNNLTADHSIPSLTVKTGLNENKLQAGFKLLYNKTVRGYLKDSRMNTARDLLVNTDYGIAEIVHLIGLSNGGYFSKLFRQEFGMAPTEYRLMFGQTLVQRK
ncbi:AraC family transcriptional regulator [Cryomorphaceae bacterium 1068]|nr:AraC family transcriptional regulator [Cryomorphaceae bacterium 1068]